METVSFICLLTLSIFGCDNSEQISPERQHLIEKFQEVDLKMTVYLATLAGPSTPLEERKKVICEDFPVTYEQEYLPIYLKLADPKDLNTSKDLQKTIDSYKARYNIDC
ncbi:hypothetical protein [Acinetobacter bereziniae]|uniref:Uncharacterized protein n=1 Tax=Acinetobacter bereziniae TaxID=106648 RepID=A0A8I1AJF6_ACIBZ|nr:hypothetical protein [Acinetobacter bereziniae]ATZ63665.1 hypothetical protein BSR55_10030 [Acinetobacter bereziniae]MBJ8443809.1 hypothetical protein [Acinetobacter bereziniae]MCU4434765.1 hypothetical protein [Acinetobacter bereziniae]NUF64636.1 hypothetical protein [Acinetobacter bereziniae]NUG08257.1 hypothetical protein [Acinetobacter bereziniae]